MVKGKVQKKTASSVFKEYFTLALLKEKVSFHPTSSLCHILLAFCLTINLTYTMLHLLPHSIIGALLSFLQESVNAQLITDIIHLIPTYSPVILPDNNLTYTRRGQKFSLDWGDCHSRRAGTKKARVCGSNALPGW